MTYLIMLSSTYISDKLSKMISKKQARKDRTLKDDIILTAQKTTLIFALAGEKIGEVIGILLTLPLIPFIGIYHIFYLINKKLDSIEI